MIVRRCGRSISTRSGGTASPRDTGYGTPLMPGCCPGATAGAGGALTSGVNKLPPVGLMFFSVGEGGAVLGVVTVVVVVVVEVDGEGFWLVAQPAATDPIATRAAPAASAVLKRLTRLEFIIHVLSFVS